MSDPVTTNKAFAIPTRGSDVGTWDVPINGDFTAIDNILGSGYAISLSSSNVTLTQTDANNLYFTLTGALLANVTISFPAIGGIFIFNNQTTGNFTVTINTVSAGQGVILQQGAVQIVYLDGTNAWNAAPSTEEIPSGTKMLFYQASAPAGWTQYTTYNDYALRVVSGAGAAPHGSVGLSSFISDGSLGYTLQIADIPAHTHAVSDPGHQHSYARSNVDNEPSGSGAFSSSGGTFASNTDTVTTGITINNTGGGGSHAHGLQDLQYLDLIICSKK